MMIKLLVSTKIRKSVRNHSPQSQFLRCILGIKDPINFQNTVSRIQSLYTFAK